MKTDGLHDACIVDTVRHGREPLARIGASGTGLAALCIGVVLVLVLVLVLER